MPTAACGRVCLSFFFSFHTLFSFDSHPYFGSHLFKHRSVLHVDLNVTASTRKIRLDDVIEMQWCSSASSCDMFCVIQHLYYRPFFGKILD